MKFKKAVYIYLGTIIFVIVAFFSAVYIYDPMYIFHKNWSRSKVRLHENMRIQAAGMLNSFEYDSIILGTSVFQDLSSSKASKLFNGTFINLTIFGSSFYERNIILKYALRKKKLKHVIFSLDSSYFDRVIEHKKYKSDQYSYLYDSNKFNDFKVYMNEKFMPCLFTFSDEKECLGTLTNLDHPKSRENNKKYMAMYGGVGNAIKSSSRYQKKKWEKVSKQIGSSKEKINKFKHVNGCMRYLDQYILDLAKKHKETKFLLVFPPYPRMKYALWAQRRMLFDTYEEIVAYVVKTSAKYENIKVYGFDNTAFTDEIKNYRDTIHFHPKFGNLILEDIASGKVELHQGNIDKYIGVISKKALDYDLHSLKKEIDYHLMVEK